jgi:hypothetical protein
MAVHLDVADEALLVRLIARRQYIRDSRIANDGSHEQPRTAFEPPSTKRLGEQAV